MQIDCLTICAHAHIVVLLITITARSKVLSMEELDPVFNRVAAYFRVLSEPMRLRIMHAVCHGEKTVSQIVEATSATQTNVSRHLSRMFESGALARRKDGNLVYYSVGDPELVELCRSVCGRIAAEIEDQQPLRNNLLRLLPKPLPARKKSDAALVKSTAKPIAKSPAKLASRSAKAVAKRVTTRSAVA